MNKIFAFISDLDNTLISSKLNKFICVEKKENKELTYMSENSLKLMKKILELDFLDFIPCTMRSLQQTMRISFINEYKPKFIICCNGAEIFINNKLDTAWEKKMRQKVTVKEVINIYKYLDNLKIPFCENRNIDNYYIVLKFNNTNDVDKYYNLLIIDNVLKKYNIKKDKRKIFIVSKFIDKSFAVEYLKKINNYKYIYGAGDSFFDTKFTQLDYVMGFLPSNHTIKNIDKKTYIAKETNSTDEILNKILQNIYYRINKESI